MWWYQIMAAKTLKTKSRLQDEDGMATIESLPLLIIFIVMLSYSIGSFGVVHTGILHSIAARNYAFETFRHRTNLTYFRNISYHFDQVGFRLHAIQTDSAVGADETFLATERRLSFAQGIDELVNRDVAQVHNEQIYQNIKTGARNQSVGVNPVWIKIAYGICLNSTCTGQ
jgi:hypothetical protein